MAAMKLARSLGIGVVFGAALLVCPALASAHATISRSGNRIRVTSDSQGDRIVFYNHDLLHQIAYYVPPGHVLRAGSGCHRIHPRHNPNVIVSCGAPSLKENDPNKPVLEVNLGAGNDTFVAAPYDDVQPRLIAEGGPGDDVIYGSTNADELKGGDGNDHLYGFDDADNLQGGEGNDLLVGGPGDDAIEGGGGQDNIFGDEAHPTADWGNDTIVSALDFTPDFTSFVADHVDCGGGVFDQAVVDAEDVVEPDCEHLSGGQETPPQDVTGVLPLQIAILSPAPTPGGFARLLRGQPLRLPVDFSAPAVISSELVVPASVKRRYHLPGRVIARGIGTPLTLIPITLNTQIRLLWKVRPLLRHAHSLPATLKIKGQTSDGATTTATKTFTVR
jgi:Ca2+-binding RTX toxin-like protein